MVGLWSWPRALVGAALSAIAVAVPTDVIDNPLFTRMTPVRWWELPVMVCIAALTAMWAGLRPQRAESVGSARTWGSSLLGALAVGCPVCNKVVIALLGTSSALAVWAPLQPLLAVASLIILATAVAARWRLRDCAPQTCPPAQGEAIPLQRDAKNSV
ncbi:hypothetical protein [Saccharothrix sp. Mg75]|uniref:hypothetical protein n=1 Tax=Saccharothrix sp. Mg75 TaxID=3445357 RepID=UPI003EE91A25